MDGSRCTGDCFPFHEDHMQVTLEEEEDDGLVDKNGNQRLLNDTNYLEAEALGDPDLP
jgi:hypothetical protein